MRNRLYYILSLILLVFFVNIFGCDENQLLQPVDVIGKDATHIADPVLLEELIESEGVTLQDYFWGPRPTDIILSDSTVQTELPADVLAAMKGRAERQADWVWRLLASTDDQEWIVIFQQQARKRGFYDMDEIELFDYVYNLYTTFFTRYIDAGGIAIVGHDKVSDEYYLFARDSVLVMTLKHPELKERLLSKHGTFYMSIVEERRDLNRMPGRHFSEINLNDDPSDDDVLSVAGCNLFYVFDADNQIGYCTSFLERDRYPMRVFMHEFAHALEVEMEVLRPGTRDRMKDFLNADALPSESDWQEYWAIFSTDWLHGRHDFEKSLLREELDYWFPKINLGVEQGY